MTRTPRKTLPNTVAALKAAQQAAGAFDGDLVQLRAWLSSKIVVGGQVDDRGDARPVVVAKYSQPAPHAFIE